MATENQRKVCDSIKVLVELVKQDESKQSNVTICMVPKKLRDLNPEAYTPQIISIGPLHKEEGHLRTMEDHKVTYMYRLFRRTVGSLENDITQIIDECVQAVFAIVKQARDCYEKSFRTYDDLEFAEMMVIDGCFILELLYMSRYGIVEGDPIFDNSLVMHGVKFDLLLLENQLPFFILDKLFHLTVERILSNMNLKSIWLRYIILCFFDDMNFLMNFLIVSELPIELEEVKHCHILGLLQSCYKPTPTNRSRVPTISYSATEIAGAGVTFNAITDEVSLLAVKFKQSPLIPFLGTLFGIETSFNIPVLKINDSTISFLRNLIAYEQCYPLSRHYVTSFAYLMDKLIDTKDDVSLLVRSRVLQHNLGSCKDITKLFNSICKGVVLQEFYYTEEWEQLNDYCNHFWPGILILLGRLYRSTTWKTLTVVGAMIIFSLTLLQTIYTARSD